MIEKSGFAKLHRDALDLARLDGPINGAEVDRGADQTSTTEDAA